MEIERALFCSWLVTATTTCCIQWCKGALIPTMLTITWGPHMDKPTRKNGIKSYSVHFEQTKRGHTDQIEVIDESEKRNGKWDRAWCSTHTGSRFVGHAHQLARHVVAVAMMRDQQRVYGVVIDGGEDFLDCSNILGVVGLRRWYGGGLRRIGGRLTNHLGWWRHRCSYHGPYAHRKGNTVKIMDGSGKLLQSNNCI